MSKICGIHQPNFLPWPGYFYKIAQVDDFVFLDNVDIEIGGSKAITNRTKIKIQSGESWISNPIIKGDIKTISEVVYVQSNWKDKNLKTIFLSYKKAPFFDEIYPLTEQIFNYESDNLSEFNIYAIKIICHYLGIQTNFLKASDLMLENEDRNGRIIEICKKCECDIYFSGRGAVNYHNEELFTENNIRITYTDFQQRPYNQLHGDFIPGLSIIDLLFNENRFII
jgi:hypothetical protein